MRRALISLSLIAASACAGDGPVARNPASDDRVASVVVSPSTGTLAVGGNLTLVANAYSATGRQLTGQVFQWSSSAGNVASVSASGVVTALAPGISHITAAVGDQSGTAQITVAAAPVDSTVATISVTPSTVSLMVGGTSSLGATALNSAGQPLPGVTFSWSTSAPAIASVSSTGLVTGVAPGGPITITVSAAGKTGSASVTVVAPSTSSGTITVNSAQQFQTMTGWDALQEIGQVACNPAAYQSYKNEVLDRAANEVGINRLSVALRIGYEYPSDAFVDMRAGRITFDQWKLTWFQPINDNSDPLVMNPNGFHWGYMDFVVDEIVRPLKQRLQARGDDLWWNLIVVGANSATFHRDNPEEYAELVVAAFTHLMQKYGYTPNSLELINEPNLGRWTPQQVANNLVAVDRRLKQAGFAPDFVGPTGAAANVTVLYFDQMAQIAGVTQTLNEISYHRYGGNSTTDLQNLAQRAKQHGMRTAMTEHIGSGYQVLHEDLTVANVSAWKQFGLAFCEPTGDDFGGLYFPIWGALGTQNSPVVITGKMTKFLRQYFRFVQLGAVRLGATSTDQRFLPVAFRNKSGKYTVIVNAATGGSFTVGALPAGTYAIDYTTAQEYMKSLPDVTITASQVVSAAIPLAGVLTIHAK